MSNYCPIGSLHLHTWNYERTECIWCGPGRLAVKPGRWVDNGNGTQSWSVEDARAEVEHVPGEAS